MERVVCMDIVNLIYKYIWGNLIHHVNIQYFKQYTAFDYEKYTYVRVSRDGATGWINDRLLNRMHPLYTTNLKNVCTFTGLRSIADIPARYYWSCPELSRNGHFSIKHATVQ